MLRLRTIAINTVEMNLMYLKILYPLSYFVESGEKRLLVGTSVRITPYSSLIILARDGPRDVSRMALCLGDLHGIHLISKREVLLAP